VSSIPSSATYVFAVAFLSYPFLFALDRGNFELLVFVLLLGFLFFFTRGRHGWGALCLGLAIALKLYPVVFLALYAPARNWRAALVAGAVAAGATLGSLLCFEGGLWANASFLLQAANFQSNWMFREFTAFSSNMVQRGVALITFIKWITIETGFFRGMDDALFLSRYLFSSALVAAAAVIYTVFIEEQLWRRVAISFVMLLLPPLSADYKLLLVYLPLYLFIDCDKPTRLDPAFLAIFGLLLVPKDYSYVSSLISGKPAHDINNAVPANIALLLLGLFIVIPGLADWIHHARESRALAAAQSGD
jgi:hypothetical protein